MSAVESGKIIKDGSAIYELLNYLVGQSGISVQRLFDHHQDWDSVVAMADYTPVSHTRSMVLYQTAYMNDVTDLFDLSLVLYHDGKPAGVWPFNLSWHDDHWKCGSNCGPVLPPVFVSSLAERSRKILIDGCLSIVKGLAREAGQTNWASTESMGPEGAGLWHRRLVEMGATMEIKHELYVDLAKTIDEIRSCIRKSYRPLISMGKKLWDVQLVDRVTAPFFEEFRNLHATVAGKVTRSVITWDLQEAAVNAGEAFCISLRNKNGVLVGAGLFHMSNQEGLYAVGAYDRNLFDQPLGHIVQMQAIEYMKSRNLIMYKIGDRPYPADQPCPSEKELSIARFKEGFATHIFFKVNLKNNID